MPIKRAPTPRSASPPPRPPSVTSAELHEFASRGWVLLPSFLSPSGLRVLQAECTALYARQSADSVAEQGCVLDAMAQCPMRDSDAARIEADRYLDARGKQFESINADDQHVFASLLFEKLPTVAAQLLAAFDDSESLTDAFFFNEHYVVKPPQSHVEFRWHRDDDEQLAMCVHRASIRPYMSAWCALDDVTSVNGALQFVSLDLLSVSDGESVEALQSLASKPVVTKAGDVLFFLSNVWHCSSSNESDAPRRAFYAQYSREKITARPNDSSPLSFAIPCSTARSAALSAVSGEAVAIKKYKHDAFC